MSRIASCFHYVVKERNPILQIVYLVVISGSFVLFMFYVWPYWRMFDRDRALNGGRNNRIYYMLHPLHYPVSVVVMTGCMVSWFLCCWADPGKITPRNHFLYFSMFKFGPIFSWNDTECKTCGHLKPARSKHCSLCKCCIAKFDHHCPWINSCVGLGNYHFFLNFLFIHWFMCLYGSYQMAVILYYIVYIDQDLFNKTFINQVSGEQFKATYKLVFHYMMSRHQIIMSLTMVGVVMGSVLFAFWFYHFVFLAMRNSTTNEQHKYGQLESFMRWRKRKKMEMEQAEQLRKLENAGNDNETESEQEIEAKKHKERERARRFMFADFDMDKWSEVNVYDLGIWMNLYTVYRPYWNVQHEIDAAQKRAEKAEMNGDHASGDQGTFTNKEKKSSSNSNAFKNGMKGGSKGQKLRKRKKSKK